MNKLNSLLLVLLSVAPLMGLAQNLDASGLFAKYCSGVPGAKEYSASIEVEGGAARLKCVGGTPNRRAYFEQVNIDLGKSSDDKFDPSFFDGEAWQKYMQSSIIRKKARDRKIDPADCTSIEKNSQGAFVIKCDKGEDVDVSSEIKDASVAYQGAYKEGADSYSNENEKEKISLKQLYAAKVAPNTTKTQEQNKTPLPNFTFSDELWEGFSPGKIVKLNLTPDQIKQNEQMWTFPTTDITKIPVNFNKPKGFDPQQFTIQKDFGTPIKFDPNFKVIPLEKNDKGEIVVKKVPEEIKKEDDPNKEDPIVKNDGTQDPVCRSALDAEISKLLALDAKNIIGLQFELTVLKMTAEVSKAQENTLEGLIRKKSNEIAALDDNGTVIADMNAMYRKHGLQDDAKEISNHLKDKGTKMNYYAKDKRFFNQDSSAFLMAYRGLNPEADIKDADVSVLWFMDKVSEKAKIKVKEKEKTKFGVYSSEHNRTNLSTRIAQYTNAINPKKAILKEPELAAMIAKQKGKIDTEFLALIQDFKKNNADCFKNLFGNGDGTSECNVDTVRDAFSQLLAVNSKIATTDLIDLDKNLSGGLGKDKMRFSIGKFVDSPSDPVTPTDKVEIKKEVVDNKQIVTPEKVNDQSVDNSAGDEHVPDGKLIDLNINTNTTDFSNGEDFVQDEE